ncbi:MAG: type II toxin-antitoxin system prevent-host-death family antitoxin [Nitrospirae bacterium]|nr:type II toxin-antitoxin system prevent-host-death family antitoxin [Nitrospirota bacterium]MCL5421435.1 type II toxin-antitoxin system prevent-host-death family antitoxin [Nitrospirota bacterium]
MIKAGIKEARQNLTGFLNKVLKGEEIVITKRGEPIAKISPVGKKPKGHLASHKALRKTLAPKGKPLSEIITELRGEERF